MAKFFYIIACVTLSGCYKKPVAWDSLNRGRSGELEARDFDYIAVIPDVHGDTVALVEALWIALKAVDDAKGRPQSVAFPGFKEIVKIALETGTAPTPLFPEGESQRVALVQLGDLMDHGPDSFKCIRIMSLVSAYFAWTVRALYGDHELMNMAGTASVHGFINAEDLGGFETMKDRVAAVQPGGVFYRAMIESFVTMVRLAGSDAASSTLFVRGGVDMKWLDKVAMLHDRFTGRALVEQVNAYVHERVLSQEKLIRMERSNQNDPIRSVHLAESSDGTPQLPCDEVAELLRRFEVSRIIIGHTPQMDHVAKPRCDGSIILADTAMSRWVSTTGVRSPTALLFHSGQPTSGPISSYRYTGRYEKPLASRIIYPIPPAPASAGPAAAALSPESAA